MNPNRIWLVGWMWICAVAALPALAQDPEDEEPAEAELQPQHMDEPDEDVQTPAQRRRSERFNRPIRTTNLDRLETLMKRELDLDQDQIDAIEHLFEERRAEYEEELAAQKKEYTEGETREKMQEMLMRMREAREAGDQEAMREISETIRNWHSVHRVEQITDEFAAQIEEVLYEDQIEPFRRFLAQGRPGAERHAALRKNPGMLRRYVMRLHLDEAQRDELEDLYAEFRDQLRSDRPSVEDREQMAAEFHDHVMELLDEDQKTQLQKYVGADEKRSNTIPSGHAEAQGDEEAETGDGPEEEDHSDNDAE